VSGSPATPHRHAWVWPAAVVGSLALFVAMYLTVIGIAGRDPHFSVEPDYYEKSMHWDETAAQIRANQELGWSVEIEPDAQVGALGDRRLACRIRDRDKRPVRGATVDLITFHHAYAAQRVELALVEESPGVYVGRPRMARPGLWECRLTVHRGVETFTHVAVVQVGANPWQP
jgi:nitrogen fixation protein FixH